jgi:hypothetical protein
MAEVTGLRNNALPYPIYGAPFGVVFPMLDADGDLVTGATTPDAERSLNGDTFADCTNESTEIATNSGMWYLLLTAAEMTADVTAVIAKSATAGMKTTPIVLYPRKLVTIRSGTSASAGSSTSTIVLDASASAVDDFYNGMVCIATIDSNVEVRVISDYTGSTQTATVVPDWNVAPDNTDTFVIKLTEGSQLNQANLTHIAGAAVSTTTAQLGVNTVSLSANAITATAINADAITAAKLHADVTTELQSGLATSTALQTVDDNVDAILVDTAEIGAAGAGLTAINLPNQTMDIVGNITGNLSGSVGSVSGAVGSVTGNVGGSINGLTAVALKDFFDTDSTTTYASAVAGSVVAEIADNAGGSALTAAAIADAVWDEAQADHVGAGSFGEVATEVAAILVDTAEIGAAGAGLTVLATQASVNTIDDLLDTEIPALTTAVADLPTNAELATALGTADDAVLTQIALVKTETDKIASIKTKTDSLTFTVAGQVDANIESVNAVTVQGDGQPGTEWGP